MEEHPDWNEMYSTMGAHWIGHHFMEYMLHQKTYPWKGTKYGERWVTFDEYSKVHFRDWAMSVELPLDMWDEVFKEYMED